MKIYKSSLHELVTEISAPAYLCNFTEFVDDIWRTVKVTVAGFNERGRLCELVLSTGPVPRHDVSAAKKQQEVADDWEKEVRTRLAALNFEVRDGRVSDSQVLGGIDG